MLGLTIAVALTIFIGLSIIIVLVSSRSQAVPRLMEVTRVQTDIPQVETKSVGEVVSAYTKWLGPIRRLFGMSGDPEITSKLALAGFRSPHHADLFYLSKLVGPLLAAVVAGFFLRGNILFWFFVLAAVGFLGPDFWLTGAIARRREAIRLALPDAIDLLVICMEAGLGMDQALIRVGQELSITHPELSEEFLLINLEQRAGKPRVEAWRAMSDRTNLEVVRSFVNMLVQTERFGTPLSKSLGYFADALRTKRRQTAEEMAAKTTIKLVFPLVLFIFPSMFIVLLGPAIISIGKSFEQSFGK